MERKELFEHLIKNKETLIAQKKAEMKKADGFSFVQVADDVNYKATTTDKSVVYKANEPVAEDVDELKVVAVINTTNWMDSHKDVHLPGIWTKSLKENKNIMHLQEHELKFASIISDGDDLKAEAKDYTWRELGYDYEGKTQALVFTSKVRKDRNAFMFDQYKKGRVKNHSVGMIYVKLLLAINDKDYPAEYDAWGKYYPEIANKEFADATGYFWVVKEAKVVEGSSVPVGSNTATPTLDNNAKSEPPEGTQKEEPTEVTLTSEEIINRIKNF